ncbi:MAG: superoxide dismutase family protein [Paludisphaera borealis]|uniref:superoxide dismutase family protein n=1 Tax=Paludisphaera borealis TaxID=1387353 RepID=UPI00283F67D2|nr:superoxide dismutase family protein [Paludisphaera borealis]MDR3619353.1 superoxide dismutase family protein [Paludisphaera borealis]
MSISKAATVLAVCGAVVTGLLGFRNATAQHAETKEAKIEKAVAILVPTKDSKVSGRVTFSHEGGKNTVHAVLHGLTPGEHGFHIHEYGVWSEDGMASGGHYNPTSHKHAGLDSKERHVGDLGNITADAKGNAELDLKDAGFLFHGPTSIIGRGVVVHAKADDLKTQPSGDAGGRLAVGVIGVAKP